MATAIAPSVRILFDPSAVRGLHNPRFAAGLFRSVPTARVPYTAADAAYEAGHAVGLADGLPYPPDHYTAAEADAWDRGYRAGYESLIDREATMLAEADDGRGWEDFAEARMANPHAEWRD